MERSKWEKLLTHFQACARGYLVRKEIRRAREDFEGIVREIEGDLAHLQWREAIIPIPHFTDTSGPLQSPRPYCSARPVKAALEVSACHQNPAAAAPLPEETGADHRLSPEKLEAERDDSHYHIQASPSRVCSPSISAGGDGEGQSHTSLEEQAGDGDGAEGMMASTGDTTTVWSSLGLDISYGQSHKGVPLYCLARNVPRTPEALRLHRNTLAMELLWLQQAIASRKKYLSLKERLSVS
ncbi:IQ domain-containing protein C [Myripristis murdjan]|uniref:IQ motif containing C n=1 Tax=Myripristis murdjan TaxID=586833 RepID=A0A668AA65_9TELE|nr:IQ domain-containing protein C [Myripristis murdjan]